MMPARRSVLLGLLALTGCDLGPRYVRPASVMPAAFRAPATTAGAGLGTTPAGIWPDPDWWHAFRSPALDGLIAQAIAHNQDIAAAAARVLQADAAVKIAGAPLLPSVQGTGGASWQQTSATTGGRTVTANLHQYNVGVSISYELDFWGKNRAALEAAQASALASRFDQETVALTVVSSVATTWLAALALQDQLDVQHQNLADAENVLRAIRARLDAGTATALDVSQQEAQVATQRAAIPATRSQLEQQLIGLGILTGQPPESITLKAGSLQSVSLPPVSPGIPAGLLTRRPDIAYAEAQLIAQNANIKAARAAFFPQISLTGSGGFASGALNTLVNPGAAVGAIAASLTQTIFDNGQKQGQLEQAQGVYAELLANYRKAVLQALTDVDNALTALRYYTDQVRLYTDAVAIARRSADIARAQMQVGTVDIVTVLNIEQTLFSNLVSLAQARGQQAQALVALYKALGGGWQEPAAIAAGMAAGRVPGHLPPALRLDPGEGPHR